MGLQTAPDIVGVGLERNRRFEREKRRSSPKSRPKFRQQATYFVVDIGRVRHRLGDLGSKAPSQTFSEPLHGGLGGSLAHAQGRGCLPIRELRATIRKVLLEVLELERSAGLLGLHL